MIEALSSHRRRPSSGTGGGFCSKNKHMRVLDRVGTRELANLLFAVDASVFPPINFHPQSCAASLQQTNAQLNSPPFATTTGSETSRGIMELAAAAMDPLLRKLGELLMGARGAGTLLRRARRGGSGAC